MQKLIENMNFRTDQGNHKEDNFCLFDNVLNKCDFK